MPTEQWANEAWTTLTNAIVTAPAPGTVEVWTVGSTAAFPQATGQCRAVVDGEIVLVATPPASGTTLSVTRGAEGTAPATHIATARLTQIITAGGMEALRDQAVTLTTAQTITGQKTISPAVVGATGLIVKGLVGQLGDLQQWRDSAGTTLTKITADGTLIATGGNHFIVGYANIVLSVEQSYAAGVGLVVKGASSQSANLQEWRNSAGTVLASVATDGNIATSTGGGGIRSRYHTSEGNAGTYLDFDGTSLSVVQRLTGTIALGVRGAASQTADLQNWQDSAGAVLLAVTIAGLPRWTAAANQQTTVGAAGGASALPATPTKYLKVVDSAGTTLVVPAYAAA